MAEPTWSLAFVLPNLRVPAPAADRLHVADGLSLGQDGIAIVPAEAAVSSGCAAAGCHATLMGGAEPASFSHAIGQSAGKMVGLTCTGCHNPHAPINSSRCVACHPQTPAVISMQTERAQRFHEVASREATECIRCHKALSHPIKPLGQMKSGVGS